MLHDFSLEHSNFKYRMHRCFYTCHFWFWKACLTNSSLEIWVQYIYFVFRINTMNTFFNWASTFENNCGDAYQLSKWIFKILEGAMKNTNGTQYFSINFGNLRFLQIGKIVYVWVLRSLQLNKYCTCNVKMIDHNDLNTF